MTFDSIGAGDPILRLALPKPGLDLSHLLIRRHARPERAARDQTDQNICQAGEYAIVRFFGGVGAGCEGIREKFGLIRRPAISPILRPRPCPVVLWPCAGGALYGLLIASPLMPARRCRRCAACRLVACGGDATPYGRRMLLSINCDSVRRGGGISERSALADLSDRTRGY